MDNIGFPFIFRLIPRLSPILFCWPILLPAADPVSPQDRIRAAMEASAAKQLQAVSETMEASIARQREVVQHHARIPDSSKQSFFILPWPTPIALPPPVYTPPCDPMPPGELEPIVKQAAQREGLEPALLEAVIERESGLRPCAVSTKGALGLMQLMPDTADQLGLQDPFDPKQNVDSGARLLRQLLSSYGGDLALALGAYNAGPSKVDAAGGIPAIPETIQYVKGILSKLPELPLP